MTALWHLGVLTGGNHGAFGYVLETLYAITLFESRDWEREWVVSHSFSLDDAFGGATRPDVSLCL